MAHGFRGVTMDDLAVELGMSKKTLYAHFPSKVALLEAVIDAKLTSAAADLELIVNDDGTDFADSLHKLLESVQRHTAEIQPAFIRDIQRELPNLFERVRSGRRQLIQQHFGKLLTRGRKSGKIRKDISLPLQIATLIGAVDAVVNPASMMELGLTPRAGFQAIISIFLEGVLVREGGTK